jgi:hypothetical protein
MNTPQTERPGTADLLIEKIAEFERQLDLNRETAVSEIDEQIGQLSPWASELAEKLKDSEGESAELFGEVARELDEFAVQLALGEKEVEQGFQEQQGRVLAALHRLDGSFHRMELAEDDEGLMPLSDLQRANRKLADKIESLHLHLDLAGSYSEAMREERDGLREKLGMLKERLHALPDEARNDLASLKAAIKEASEDTLEALKTFFQYEDFRPKDW